MPTLYLASYKGTQSGWRGWVNRGIRFFTKSQYSHSELCSGHPFNGPVDCLSSAGSEGGVRIKRMALNPAKWDVLPVPGVPVDALYQFYAENKNTPYDHIGCVRSVLPFVGHEHPRRWFCSEVCAHVMGYAEAWRLHPGVLHQVAQLAHRRI